MYLKHFGLDKRPFSITPDPSLMVWTPQHRRVFDGLVATLSETPTARLAVLTGEIGCGKSTILRACLEDPGVAARFHSVLISIAVRSARELFDHIFTSIEGETPACPPEEHVDRLAKLCADTVRQGRTPLLILDEAQTMAPDAGLLLARLLGGGIQPAHAPAMLLAGQPELDALLARPDLAPLAERIGTRLRLGKLSREETDEFIRGRLSHAGAADSGIFEPDAVALIHEATRGTPRLVNKVCDLGLFAAARQQRTRIDGDFARSVLDQFGPLGVSVPRAGNGADSGPDFLDGFELPAAEAPVVPAARSDASAPPGDPADNAQQAPGPDIGMARVRTRRAAFFGFLRGATAGVALCALLLVVLSYLDPDRMADVPDSSAEDPVADRVSGLRFPALSAPSSPAAALSVWEPRTEPSEARPPEAEVGTRDTLEAQLRSGRAELNRLNREIENAERELAALQALRVPTVVPEQAANLLSRVTPPQPVRLVTPLSATEGDADFEPFFERALASTSSSEIVVNYARAALRGHARAARYLGQLFETGDGVALDAGIAGRWYAVARDPEQLHAADLATAFPSRGPALAIPMGSVAEEGTAEFVWHGRAAVFTLELADAQRNLLARAQTGLTAIRLPLPEGAAFWRVRAGEDETPAWRPIRTAGE